jgi:hypothetical protein
MEAVFKVGDEVYDISYGWGKVKEEGKYSRHGLQVVFGEFTARYCSDGTLFGCKNPTLSFTEYTLQGLTQERPINLPEVGELCLMRDADDEGWKALVFREYLPSEEYPYKSGRLGYKQLKRIKILD